MSRFACFSEFLRVRSGVSLSRSGYDGFRRQGGQYEIKFLTSTYVEELENDPALLGTEP